MSDDFVEKNAIVPLDKTVWEEWLAQKRVSERLMNARITRIAIGTAVALLIFAIIWLTRHH